MTDEQLAARAHNGDQAAAEALIGRHVELAYAIASAWFDSGGDRDDVRQEALIGACKAVRDYRPGHGTTFRSFLGICVRRHLIDATRATNRGKHQTLTYAQRHAINDDGETIDIVDLLEARNTDPCDLLALRDDVATVVRIVRHELSPLERIALLGVANGATYEEIEASLLADGDGDRPGRAKYSPIKVVDNAITRARRKISVALGEAA